MKVQQRHLLLAVGGGVLGVVGLVGVLADSWRLTALAVLALQGAVLLVALDVHRRQGVAAADARKHQKQLDRRVDNVSSRVVTESQAQAKQIRTTEGKVLRSVRNEHQETRRSIERITAEGSQDVEALLQLFAKVTPRAALPSTGRWALAPTDLLAVLDLVEKRRPATVVEMGSGTSTIWLGYTLERLGHGRVVAVEHDEYWGERTRRSLAAHGLDSVAEVRIGALGPASLTGHDVDWYDVTALDGVEQIDVLLVDGPPEATGTGARYPAVPMLADRLAPGALVVLDDTDREAEAAIVDRWIAETPGLVRLDAGGPGHRHTALEYRP